MIERRLGKGILAGLLRCFGHRSARRRRRWRARASRPPSRSTSRRPSPRSRIDIHSMHDYVNVIIFLITGFVLVLMLYVMWRFSESRNPTPSRTTHNTTVEVLWTVIPVLILVAIAIPSFKLLFFQYTFPPPDLTIKATGARLELDARVSRPGHQRRFGDAAGQRSARSWSSPASPPGRCRATWPSTMRSWCPSTRWCTCWSPPAT